MKAFAKKVNFGAKSINFGDFPRGTVVQEELGHLGAQNWIAEALGIMYVALFFMALNHRKSLRSGQFWVFFVDFVIFGVAFAALTGGTDGVARCHLQGLAMRYDKNKKFRRETFFEKPRGKTPRKIWNLRKIENSDRTKSDFFEIKILQFSIFQKFPKKLFGRLL